MSKYKKFLVAADNHGSLVCQDAKKVLLSFAETWKPDYRVHLGDLWDFSPLRRGASQEEKADGISDDFIQGLEFLDDFKPNFLTLGNHDDRIYQHATHCMGSYANDARSWSKRQSNSSNVAALHFANTRSRSFSRCQIAT